jgi:hypothetical protein
MPTLIGGLKADAEPALGCDPEATIVTFLFLESGGADFFDGAFLD